jgi:hypothetical protein
MTDYKNLKGREILQGIHETQNSIKKADQLLQRAVKAEAVPPSALGLLAESTSRLRLHLSEDLRALEDALNKLRL